MKRKKFKLVAWILTSILALFLLFATWYKFRYSMDPVAPYTLNSETLENKLLIATQGSAFKDAVVRQVIEHYQKDSLFIKVVDVSDLPKLDSSDYVAVLILHTWEYDKPPKVVADFVIENKDDAGKLILLSTSGEGGNTIEGVDGIGGASIISDVPNYSMKIIKRLDGLLIAKE
ncbi:hypothetical protein GTQ34_05235 [Muricauda sp. JGD-17]|uniref:Uncharacterized protein n=1 Tax=Flagellimonas ochracea TaxID=2696472 RepID=A0A964WWQ5_9FLAO|nr:hypothetical protein [Allomuricauda ochracea]NAY91316.1 hypothetical protein [Allomuricauda ochracea]